MRSFYCLYCKLDYLVKFKAFVLLPETSVELFCWVSDWRCFIVVIKMCWAHRHCRVHPGQILLWHWGGSVHTVLYPTNSPGRVNAVSNLHITCITCMHEDSCRAAFSFRISVWSPLNCFDRIRQRWIFFFKMTSVLLINHISTDQ